jgi:hypothetical protein
MLPTVACEALQKGICLELRYDGYARVVEVHAVGRSTAGHEVMRVYQLRGGSVSGERQGWKLMRLDEAVSGHLTDEKSQAPRSGYARNDSHMHSIRCQL